VRGALAGDGGLIVLGEALQPIRTTDAAVKATARFQMLRLM
jgi:hypothetical protein